MAGVHQMMVAASAAGATDHFTSDSLGSYAAIQQGGAPSWVISDGKLNGSGGTQALLLRSGVSTANGAVECASDLANDAGLVMRVQDVNNYYLCVFSDDASTDPVNNIRLFKCIAGGFTLLSQANMAWARGAPGVVKMSISNTTIKAFFNGAEVLSVVDTAIANAGGVGLRHNAAAQNSFDRFTWGLSP